MATATKAQIPVGTLIRHSDKSEVSNQCPEGRDNNTTATIVCYLPELAEGAVRLDRDLHGSRYWNIDELEIAE